LDGWKAGLAGEHLRQMGEGEQGAAEYPLAVPACELLAVSCEGDGEAAQFRCAVLDLGDGDGLADHEQAVYRVGGDRVHYPEVPVCEWALHDLEAVRDPVDALQDRGLIASDGQVRAKWS
jgi:hypothetical protein